MTQRCREPVAITGRSGLRVRYATGGNNKIFCKKYAFCRIQDESRIGIFDPVHRFTASQVNTPAPAFTDEDIANIFCLAAHRKNLPFRCRFHGEATLLKKTYEIHVCTGQ